MAIIPDFESYQSIAEAFYGIAEQAPDVEVYLQAQINEGDSPGLPRQWKGRTARIVRERIEKVAHRLKAIGVQRGDRVAIISQSRPEWMEADLACHTLGAVVVSVYQSIPVDDVGYILFDSGADVLFIENQEQLDKIKKLLKEPVSIPPTEEREGSLAQIGVKKIIAFEQVEEHPLVIQWDEIVVGPEVERIEQYRTLTREDLAALVYTSGTTGPPKGVMQTHGNHLANVRQAYECRLVEANSRLIVFLPLAHAFAKLMGYLGFLGPAKILFPAIKDKRTSKLDPDSTTKDIREGNAHIVPVVPRLLEKMQSGIQAKARSGGLQGMLVGATLQSAERVYAGNADVYISILYSITAFMRAGIRKKLFGENFQYCISGGAKLNPQVARFFDSLGIEVLEGYGLTETCVATNVNRSGNKKIGSVGPVLAPDIECRIDQDGEILFRGPNIAKGYYKRESATRAAWDSEGWFHTGDLGEIDTSGFLSIVGRKKDILVTSYGKNIAPEDIEAQMKSSLYISQIVLIGDGRPYITAIVTLNLPIVVTWAKKIGIKELDGASLASNDKVRDLIWKDIQQVNKDLANYESVKKFAIVPEDFTVENGFLTPTFKVKRPVVLKAYVDLVESLYSGGE